MHEQCHSDDRKVQEQKQSVDSATIHEPGAKRPEHKPLDRGADGSQCHLGGGHSARLSFQYKQKGSTRPTESQKLSAQKTSRHARSARRLRTSRQKKVVLDC